MQPSTVLTTVVIVVSVCAGLIGQTTESNPTVSLTYPIVDTGQTHCFSDTGQLFRLPRPGQAYFGQDAHYLSNPPRYRDNGNGTISDLNTGLMWQKTPDLDNKPTFRQAAAGAKACRLAGYSDWRLPVIKELYSLIDFNGNVRARSPVPYVDTQYFDFCYGNERGHNGRNIDAQYWSATEYVGTTMQGATTVFGVNFADGRIKGYPRDRGRRGGAMTQFARYVRGNPDYGVNQFVDNQDGTISDLATGLMWAKTDSTRPMNWRAALTYCENLQLAGYADWRLPNAKELQSIVDYTRAPDAQQSSQRGPAIDPIFKITDSVSWAWTSTTHMEAGRTMGSWAAYVAFGMATGNMSLEFGHQKRLINVHGAGAQRSDPKTGNSNASQWRDGFGPQGDTVRINNYVRAVRNIDPDAVKIVQPDTDRLPENQHHGMSPARGKKNGNVDPRFPVPRGRR